MENRIPQKSYALIEELLQIFQKAGWSPELDQSNQNTKFRLPRITVKDFNSEPNKKIENLDTDGLLGCYKQVDGSWKSEGEIELYDNSIIGVAKTYTQFKEDSNTQVLLIFVQLIDSNSLEISQTEKEVVEDLYCIVLLHEISHWIVHCLPKNDLPIFDDISGNDYFHESLAQLLTHWIIKPYPQMEALFNWLMKHQSECYTIFAKEQIKNKFEFSKVMTEYSYEEVIKAISYCRTNQRDKNSQNFKILGRLIKSVEQKKDNQKSVSDIFLFEKFGA